MRVPGPDRPPATSPEQVVERLLAVQAQDPRGFRLAVRSRSTGLSAADVDTALTDGAAGRELAQPRHAAPRGGRGLLVAAPADHPAARHRQARAGCGRKASPRQAERGVEVIADAVATRAADPAPLRDRLDDAGVPTARQALVHVLLAATCPATSCAARWSAASRPSCRRRAGWAPPPEPLDRDEALARLARRYLVGHGPADARDLAYWAGIALGEPAAPSRRSRTRRRPTATG